ncbi:glycoprotein precursor [Emaravirus idaeobati]|uniref:Glycoprotein n=1 Tax=Emaravirus idaeobati TaxID=1980431 RepID=F8K9Y8_9VIRU|nr:glycoprotein precursor [Emaravirus idaeobati]CBZ42025.1 glycoprotein precursor [Emaravirus idaeobati]
MKIMVQLILLCILLQFIASESSESRPDSEYKEADENIHDCSLKVVRLDGIQLACRGKILCWFSTNAVAYNDTCWKLTETSTHFHCCNKYEAVIYKISDESRNICYDVFSHSWCVFLSNLYHFILAILIWIIMALARVPFLYIFKIIDLISGKILKKKKSCVKCEDKYAFFHIDCSSSTRKRVDYNTVYYTIVILVIFLVPVFASGENLKDNDSKFNTYDHSGYTEFVVKDVEHEVNEFYTKTNHIKITIEKSYISYVLSYSHDVLKKTNDVITSLEYSCDSEEKCYRSLKGDNRTFRSLKKNHDGLSCIFSNAIVCMACSFHYELFAEVYTVTEHKPIILMSVEINNSEKYNITLSSYNDYVDENFYIRSLNAVDFTDDIVLIKGLVAYKGKICTVPSLDCFGSHIKKDNKILAMYNPIITDNNHYDTTVNLVKCTENENLDLLRLSKIGLIVDKDRVIEDRSFGYFSVGVRNKMLLDNKICEKDAIVRSIEANGCYNCKFGFNVKINYKLYSECGKIECKTPIYKSYTYVSNGTTANIKLYSDDYLTKITCNGKEVQIKLDSLNIDSYYHNNAYTTNNLPIKSRIKNVLNLALYDSFKMAVLTIILILFSYTILSILIKLRRLNKRSTHKVLDNTLYAVDMSHLRNLGD